MEHLTEITDHHNFQENCHHSRKDVAGGADCFSPAWFVTKELRFPCSSQILYFLEIRNEKRERI